MSLFEPYLATFSDDSIRNFLRNDLGPGSLQEIEPVFKILKQIALAATIQNPVAIPANVTNDAKQKFEQIQQECNRIKDLAILDQNFASARMGIINNITAFKDQLLVSLSPYIDLASEGSDIKNSSINLNVDLEQKLERGEKLLKDLNSSSEALSSEKLEVFTTAGTDKAKTYFTQLGNKYRDLANIFAAVSIIIILIIGVYAYFDRNKVINVWREESIPRALGMTFPHLSLISLLLLALGICLKYYRINSHLSVVCDFKTTSLQAGDAFSRALESDEDKKLVLDGIVRTVFSGIETGYLGRDGKTEYEGPSLSYLIDFAKNPKVNP